MGFKIEETMTGHHRFAPGMGPSGRHAFRFEVRWGPESLVDWLNPLSPRFMWQELAGTVTIGGFCEEVPCRGTLELEYHKQRLRYSFDFEVDGTVYRFEGEKSNLRPWNLIYTHTTCFGTVVELATGKLISTSVTEFRWRSLPRFLMSLRWA